MYLYVLTLEALRSHVSTMSILFMYECRTYAFDIAV